MIIYRPGKKEGPEGLLSRCLNAISGVAPRTGQGQRSRSKCVPYMETHHTLERGMTGKQTASCAANLLSTIICVGGIAPVMREIQIGNTVSHVNHTRVYYLRFQTRRASSIITISKSRILKGSRSPTSTLSCRGRRSRFNCTHERSTQACDVLEACCLLPLLPLKTWKYYECETDTLRWNHETTVEPWTSAILVIE